jgi:hypothetical protein
MNTRRAGLGVHDADRCCTQQTSSAFASAHNAVLPSTPAVLRPALSCATRRTLSKAFARERSINLCKLRTLFRSPSCDAVKIRCRKRRTSRSARSQSTWSQSNRSSSGPFTATAVAASNVPIGSNVVVIATSTDSPDPRQRPFGPRHQSLSGRLSPTTSRSLVAPPGFPVTFRPPAFASRVIPSPLGTSAFLTVGPPTTTAAVSDPIGIATFRTCKMRPDWVPSRPRGGGTHPARSTLSAGACRFPAASPARPAPTSHLRAPDDEATSRVHSRSPARSFPHP